MSRTCILFSLAAVLTISSACRAAQSESPAAPAARPNIIFIMADDHGKQATSCYGGSFIKTPNIDRLASEGIRFNQAMAGNSICSPSRAMLLTGKYNHLCGVRRLEGHFDGASRPSPSSCKRPATKPPSSASGICSPSRRASITSAWRRATEGATTILC